MSRSTPSAQESADTTARTDVELDDRTRRALAESLSVLTPRGTPVTDGDRTLVSVVSHSGEEYRVDVREGRCTCPDHEHRDADCKHRRRARFALGREAVPAAALEAVDVDPNLGANAPGPAVATSDGGIVEAGDDGEVLTDDDDRPDDCDCGAWNADGELPCWPCYREGYDTPAVPEPSADE